MEKTRVIILEGERPPSNNRLYSRVHWSVRDTVAATAKYLVRTQIAPDSMPYENKVEIEILVYFEKSPYDACNIPAKIYIDGLIKGRGEKAQAGNSRWLIYDDSPRYIKSVKTIPLIDRKNPRVEIHIKETDEPVGEYSG